MSGFQVNSSSEFGRTTSHPQQQYDDSALEGVAAHVKLLLKLIKDHKDACDNKEKKNDARRMLRVATMMTILDTIRSRIQKCQSFGGKRYAGDDEKDKLRRELGASLAARKSLEIMCSSLGKEKEIMAAELLKKVHELSEMEELINDLKDQNETLLEKVRECALKHRDESSDDCLGGRGGGGGGGGEEGEAQGNASLQERNKVLSEQLLRSLDGNRSMKMKLRDAEEENVMMQSAMDEMRAEVVTSLERVRSFKERMLVSSESNIPPVDVQEEIVALENMFECFQMLVAKYDQKQQGECAKITSEINARKPSVLA
ncbi:hypothetical protein Salat_0355700 [Sesamum alatum]|uniref:Uncharacterized protein n=1 Tax=Sesamum alatum TaxID=300844 RepID=A0AAE2CZH4_9LAMI|nr:hypothetical protein Salat_0355700 [Sesamum alatum]